MKIFKFFVLSMLLAIMAKVNAFAQITAEQIFDNYNKATNYREIENRPLMVEADFEIRDQKSTIKTIAEHPNKLRTEMIQMGVTSVTVVNDNHIWRSIAGKEVQALHTDITANANRLTVGEFIRYFKSGNQATYIQNQTIDGVECYEVQVVDKPVTLFFEVETSLLVCVVTRNQNAMEDIMVVSDYKEFSGVKIPTVFKSSFAGFDGGTMTITNLVLDYPTEEWMFEKPE